MIRAFHLHFFLRALRPPRPAFFSILVLLLLPQLAQAITVVATLPPLGGLVHLLDPRIRVHCLLPAGGDPHHFQLTPKQVTRLKHADLLLRAGRDDAHWTGIDLPGHTLVLWPQKDHAWLLPMEVKKILPRIAAALQRLDPGRRAEIQRQLAAALHRCERMEQRWRLTLMPYRRRGVIMQHPAWLRLCRHFGVPVRAVLEPHHHGGIRPRKLQKALDILRARPATVLWADARHGNQGLDWLRAHSTATTAVRLDALGDCAMSWTRLMQKNLAALARGAT